MNRADRDALELGDLLERHLLLDLQDDDLPLFIRQLARAWLSRSHRSLYTSDRSGPSASGGVAVHPFV